MSRRRRPEGVWRSPASPEVERAVLASVLLDPSIWPELSASLEWSDLTEKLHQRLWQAMDRLEQAGRPVADPHLLASEFPPDERPAVQLAIAELADTLPDLTRYRHYADVVRAASISRQVQVLLADSCFRLEDGDPRAVLDSLLAAQALVDNGVVEAESATYRDLIRSGAARLEAIRRGDRRAGWPTGYSSIDAEIVGLRAGEVAIVGGYASAGKTTWLEQLVLQLVAWSGARVFVLSLEMSREDTEDRIFSRLMSLRMALLRQGHFTAEALESARAAGDSEEWVDRVSTSFPGFSRVRDLDSLIRATYRRRPFDILVFDHLHEVTDPQARGDERQAAAAAALMLREVARELGVAVVGAAQIGRTEGTRPPEIRDLAWSGKIEQVAALIFLLYRPGEEPLQVQLAKIRQGDRRPGPITMVFDPRTRALREQAPAWLSATAPAPSAQPEPELPL